MSGGNHEPGRTVASKLLTVMDTLAGGSAPMTLTSVSRESGLPLTTVHRLVNELLAWGGVERDAEGRYQIGHRLWEIGTNAPRRTSLREIGLPAMEDLYEATHENVQLVVPNGDHCVCIERINGPKSVPTLTRVGGKVPYHATAVGKVLLAYGSSSLVDTTIARGLRAWTQHTIVDGHKLRHELDLVRRHGVGVAREEWSLGCFSIAAPVVGQDHQVVGSVAIVTSSRLRATQSLVQAVKMAAMGMSHRLAEWGELDSVR